MRVRRGSSSRMSVCQVLKGPARLGCLDRSGSSVMDTESLAGMLAGASAVRKALKRCMSGRLGWWGRGDDGLGLGAGGDAWSDMLKRQVEEGVNRRCI